MERYYLELEKEYMPYAIFDKTGTMIALKQDTPIEIKKAVKEHILMSRKFDDITNYDYWDKLIEQLGLSNIEF